MHFLEKKNDLYYILGIVFGERKYSLFLKWEKIYYYQRGKKYIWFISSSIIFFFQKFQ